MLLYHLLQHHTLTGFFQKDAAVSSNFLQNTVCKTLKAQDINIQDSPARTHLHQCLLGLHGKLLRHDHIKKLLRMQPCLFYDILISITGFSASGTSYNKL